MEKLQGARQKGVLGWYKRLLEETTGYRRLLLYILHYTLLFAVLWPLCFSAFNLEEKSFIWRTDATSLWCTELVHLSRTVRPAVKALLNGEGWTFPMYDFTRGVIENDLRLEPIQLLAIFCPSDQIDHLYNLIAVLRYYLSGVAFVMFGFYFHSKCLPILIGAVSYTFCGYALYAGIRHPFFMQAMIYLPLLIVCIEKAMRKESPFPLMGIVFLILISNVYFACMLAIFSVIYVLVRFPALYRQNRLREFGRMIGSLAVIVGISAALSGALFVAPLLQNLRTGRVGNNDVFKYIEPFAYKQTYYPRFIADFIMTERGPSYWTVLGFSVLAIPAIALLFVNRKKNERTLRILFCVLTAMLMFPVVGFIMGGFNSINNRWSYAYAFLICAIIMFEAPLLREGDHETLCRAGLVITLYVFICYFVINHAYFIEHAAVMLAATMLSVALCRKMGMTGLKLILPVCLLATCFSVYYAAHLRFDSENANYVAEFLDKDEFYQIYEASPYRSFAKSETKAEDGSFYRVAHNYIDLHSSNSAFYSGVNGITGYGQWRYLNYEEWTRENEMIQNGVFGIFLGLDSRTAAQALDGVKYYVQRQGSGKLELYGYTPVEQIENGKNTDVIMKNEYALPVGFTYDCYLTKEEYEALNGLGRQEAQLQAAVLESAPRSSGIVQAAVQTTAEQIPVQVTDIQNATWKKGKIKVKEGGGSVTLTFEGLPQTETYLRVVNLDCTKGASTRGFALGVQAQDYKTTAVFHADAYIYSNGMKTQLINLGYTEDGITTCTLTFPLKGTFILDDLQIWCQPMDHFAEQIDALREEALENVKTNWRGLSGDIAVSKDKILCLSVPYAEGWTAYVDGKKAEILQVNTAFMGLELEAGEHRIEFKYWTPGLTAGIILSIAGVFAAVGYVMYWKNKGKQQWKTEQKKL